jgi:hypothetical protein
MCIRTYSEKTIAVESNAACWCGGGSLKLKGCEIDGLAVFTVLLVIYFKGYKEHLRS